MTKCIHADDNNFEFNSLPWHFWCKGWLSHMPERELDFDPPKNVFQLRRFQQGGENYDKLFKEGGPFFLVCG